MEGASLGRVSAFFELSFYVFKGFCATAQPNNSDAVLASGQMLHMLRFKRKHTRILGILPKYSYRHMVRHRRTGSVRKVRCSRRGNTYKTNFSDFEETLSAGFDPPKSGHSRGSPRSH